MREKWILDGQKLKIKRRCMRKLLKIKVQKSNKTWLFQFAVGFPIITTDIMATMRHERQSGTPNHWIKVAEHVIKILIYS